MVQAEHYNFPLNSFITSQIYFQISSIHISYIYTLCEAVINIIKHSLIFPEQSNDEYHIPDVFSKVGCSWVTK